MNLPRHEQLSNWLRTRIADGTYEADEQLPSEHTLCDQFDVSRVTVRRALQTLESEGLIYRKQGLGSFVQDQRMRPGLVRLTDFAEDMAQAGIAASSRIVMNTNVEVPASVSAKLGVKPGTTVRRLDRTRLGDGQPVAFDYTWLPLNYASLIEPYDLAEQTIYSILETEHDVEVRRGQYRIEAANASDTVAEALGVPPGTALLLISRLSIGAEDAPIYYQQRYYRTDRVAYELELERGTTPQPAAAGMSLRDFTPVFSSDADASS
ncbi:MAG: GntR family transcriptional regulator [Longimonas sp.]|uniref:GntR family transcriptional regulator n=1 Tax=Longimonas sp. TaxID=2039626 RepID=UPI003356B256